MSRTDDGKDGGVVRVYGLIPAAGRSRRMGRPKQLLPFGESTILETVIESVLAGHLDGLVVVTNPQVNRALRLTRSGRHLTAVVDDPDAEMIESVMLGVDALTGRYHPGEDDAFMVCPGDIAGVTGALVAACAAEYRANPVKLVVASFGARTAHPIVVPFAWRSELDALRGAGLKRLLVTHAGRVRRVPAVAPESIADLDTPEDYERTKD